MLHPVDKIALPDWAITDEVKQLVNALDSTSVRFVGGSVRNYLLKESVKDIDIATINTPEEVMSLLNKAGIRNIPTGIDHGTITAVINHTPFEITTLRKDIETNGRHAIVSFTKDWREDALRRDFTMNTLLMDMEGNIYDPTGRGLADLKRRKIIFVGDPETRINEDYLRILRFFRFHAAYGEGLMDDESLSACIKLAGNLVAISKERITDELIKILSLNRSVDTLKVMKENNILPELFGRLIQFSALKNMCKLQKEVGSNSPELKILVLADCDEVYLSEIIDNLCLSKKRQFRLKAVIRASSSLDFNSTKSLKVQIYKKKTDVVLSSLILMASFGRIESNKFTELYDFTKNWKVPVMPVTGKDLLIAGIPEGEQIGVILQQIEDWWVENDFIPDKQVCLAQIKP